MIILYMNKDTDNFIKNSIDNLLYKCKKIDKTTTHKQENRIFINLE